MDEWVSVLVGGLAPEVKAELHCSQCTAVIASIRNRFIAGRQVT